MPIIVHGSGGTSYNAGSAPLNPFGAPSMLDPELQPEEQLTPTGMNAIQVRKLIEENASKTGRTNRQLDADTHRLLNQIMGPRPEAPTMDPFLQLDLRNVGHDPWRQREVRERADAYRDQLAGFGNAQQARANALQAIMAGYGKAGENLIAGREADTRAIEAATRKSSEESLTNLRNKQASALETKTQEQKDEEDLRRQEILAKKKAFEIQTGQLEPETANLADIIKGVQDPVTAFKMLRQAENQRSDTARALGKEAAAPSTVYDLMRAMGQGGVPMEAVADRIMPTLGARVVGKVFGQSEDEKLLDSLIGQMSQQEREMLFPRQSEPSTFQRASRVVNPANSPMVQLILQQLGL